jgi:hypothetical protein
MAGVTGTVTGKVTGLSACDVSIGNPETGGVAVGFESTEYHLSEVRDVTRPWTAEAPAATLPEEHMCGFKEPVGRPLVLPLSNLVTQYFEPGISGVVAVAAILAG